MDNHIQYNNIQYEINKAYNERFNILHERIDLLQRRIEIMYEIIKKIEEKKNGN